MKTMINGKRIFRNDKGQTADPTLIPPDLKRCQAFPNMMNWSFMTLGPKPTPIRCEKTSRFVIVENKPATNDGRIGSMAVCDSCLALFRKNQKPGAVKTHVI